MNDLLLFVYHNYSIYLSQGMVNRREFFIYVRPKMCYCLWKSIKNYYISTADKHFLYFIHILNYGVF